MRSRSPTTHSIWLVDSMGTIHITDVEQTCDLKPGHVLSLHLTRPPRRNYSKRDQVSVHCLPSPQSFQGVSLPLSLPTLQERTEAMRCHLATAVSIRSETRNPLQIVLRNVTRPLADGLNLAEHLVAGAVATGAAVASMHPMDTVKTVVQAAGKTAQNTSTFSAFFSTVRTGGIPALYKGLAVSLSGQVPAGAVKFAAFESFTQFALTLSGKKSNGPAVDFACAALAFVCCSVVLVPGELMKQRLQAGLYPGVRAGIRTILKTEGARALYTGYRATLLRDVPYTMLEFGLYSQFKRALRAALNKPKLTPREEIVLGGVAGGCTGFLTTPLDLAKTRLMTQGVGASGVRQYKGILDVLAKVVKSEGPAGLFKGSTARVVWLIPFTAVFFGVHEASKRALLQRKLTSVTAQKPKES